MTSPPSGVPERVVDLFAASGQWEPMEGGPGGSVRVGDLVLSPGRDAPTTTWLSPVQARLAVRLDEERPRALRLSLPVPARDGRWVVDGWAATRYEPGTTHCTDLDVVVASVRLLGARLAVTVRERPGALDVADHRWARADRLAWDLDDPGPGAPDLGGPPWPEALGRDARDLLRRVLAAHVPVDLPSQLVHGDLVGNLLLDASGCPFVIDLAPHWRPARWAEAVAVLDAVLWEGADPGALAAWTTGAPRQLMLRAVAFRLLSDAVPDVPRYGGVVAGLGAVEPLPA